MYRDTKQITDCFTRGLGEELERRNYEELEGDCEDRDCGTYRIVRSRWRLRLRTGNDLAASPAGITSGGAVC